MNDQVGPQILPVPHREIGSMPLCNLEGGSDGGVRRLTATTRTESDRASDEPITAVPTFPLAPAMTMRMSSVFPLVGRLGREVWELSVFRPFTCPIID